MKGKKIASCLFILLFMLQMSFSLLRTNNTSAVEPDIDLTGPSPKAELFDDCTLMSKIDKNYGYFTDIVIKRYDNQYIAFVISSSVGLLIFDVSNPQKITFLSQFSNSSSIVSVAVDHDIAYILSDYRDLILLDISSLKHPRFISRLETAYFATEIRIYGNYLFLMANGYSFISIYDKTNPFNLEFITIYNNNSYFFGIAFQDKFIYFIGNNMFIYNIDELTEDPIILNSFSASDIYIKGNQMILFTSHSIQFLDFSNKTSPELMYIYYDLDYYFTDVAIYDDFLYVLTGNKGILTINIADLSNPEILGFDSLPGENYGCDLYLNFLTIIDRRYGLKILEINEDDHTLSFIGAFRSSGATMDVCVKDNFAYVANYRTFSIYNIINPYRPRELATIYNPEESYYIVEVNNNTAFIFDDSKNKIYSYDITNKKDPIKIAEFQFTQITTIFTMKLYDSEIFIAYQDNLYYNYYISILDISDPTNITMSNISYDIPGRIYDLKKVDSTLFVGSTAGFFIFEIINSTTINYITSFDENNRIYAIDIYENYAFLACYDYGLKILDITDFDNIQKIDQIRTSNIDDNYGATEIKVAYPYLYMLDYDGGLYIYHILNPGESSKVGQFFHITYFLGIVREFYGINLQEIEIYENIIYIAASLDGLLVAHYKGLPLNSAFLNRITIIYSVFIGTGFCVFVTIVIIRRRRRRFYR